MICGAAARNGQLEALKLLRDNGLPWNHFTCAFVAKGGHFKMLK